MTSQTKNPPSSITKTVLFNACNTLHNTRNSNGTEKQCTKVKTCRNNTVCPLLAISHLNANAMTIFWALGANACVYCLYGKPAKLEASAVNFRTCDVKQGLTPFPLRHISSQKSESPSPFERDVIYGRLHFETMSVYHTVSEIFSVTNGVTLKLG